MVNVAISAPFRLSRVPRLLSLSVFTIAAIIGGGCTNEGSVAPAFGASSKELTEAKRQAQDLQKQLDLMRSENARLNNVVRELEAKVKDLSLTPQALLASLGDTVRAEKLPEASLMLSKLQERFADSPQAKEGKVMVAKLRAAIDAREEQRRLIEAKGFYAIKTQKVTRLDIFNINLESVSIGTRWSFDSHEYESYYREAARGEKFVLLRLTLTNLANSADPSLPDIGIYTIEGKNLVRVGQVNYEFRRWSNYGAYLGTYHDFKNDFKHTASIPFNAAAEINEDYAKVPFAVVATGDLCHERRTERIQRPEIHYVGIRCTTKSPLTAEDFQKGDAKVLAFFNKPKGG